MSFDPSRLGALSAAILSDVMDAMGLRNQVLRPFVRPLDERLVLVGRARTGLYMPAYSVRQGENPYEIEMALIDDLQAGDVPVLACNGPTERIAPWGELLSTACLARRAAGCVTDGLVRDVRQIRQMGFPVFHGGIGPLDTKGRAKMIERDIPVECAGAPVCSGDIVFGDADGVAIIPQGRAEEVLGRATEKVLGEDKTREALLKGEKLSDVFKRYGVL